MTEPGRIDDLIRAQRRKAQGSAAASARAADDDRLRELRERVAVEEGVPDCALFESAKTERWRELWAVIAE